MQDSLEFATPRIHNPIYEFSSGCFDKDSGTFVYDPRFDTKNNYQQKLELGNLNIFIYCRLNQPLQNGGRNIQPSFGSIMAVIAAISILSWQRRSYQ